MTLTSRRPSKGDQARQKILEEVTNTTEEKKRLNADIDKSLHHQIKMKCSEEGRSISEITKELWVEYLSK